MAGTGKSSLAAHFVDAACRRGERCAYCYGRVSGSDHAKHAQHRHTLGSLVKGLLSFDATASHISRIGNASLEDAQAGQGDQCQSVVVDPITSYISLGDTVEVKSMLSRLIDFFKAHQITAFFTSLTEGKRSPAIRGRYIFVDGSWILLRHIESNG